MFKLPAESDADRRGASSRTSRAVWRTMPFAPADPLPIRAALFLAREASNASIRIVRMQADVLAGFAPCYGAAPSASPTRHGGDRWT
jgi:hypothetical protein